MQTKNNKNASIKYYKIYNLEEGTSSFETLMKKKQ
jgi:hypothetical protein